jgi:hypothetical protein
MDALDLMCAIASRAATRVAARRATRVAHRSNRCSPTPSFCLLSALLRKAQISADSTPGQRGICALFEVVEPSTSFFYAHRASPACGVSYVA